LEAKAQHYKIGVDKFNLNSKEAKRELNINHSNETLLFCSEPEHLGVNFDRSLTYRRHLQALRIKLTSRVALLKQLAGFDWGAGAKTLRTAIFAQVHSTAEYFDPVSCRSVALLTLPSRRLANCDLVACVPHQRTTFLSSQAFNPLRVVVKEAQEATSDNNVRAAVWAYHR